MTNPNAFRELLDEVALGYYAISICNFDDEYWRGVLKLVREARAEIRRRQAEDA